MESLKIGGAYSSVLLADTLVVPVLEVLVDGSLLRVLVLAHHGREADLLGGGVAVHGLLEVGIAGMVLSFEGDGVGGGNHVEDVRVLKRTEGSMNEKKARAVTG